KGNRNGYVLSFNYGDLKTWRPGTYDLFAKYYNQPQGTYLAHGMNGIGNWLQGFRGYGLGVHYTFAENLVGGMEYFDLRDKVTGGNAQTWWNQLTYYF
ncbi:MAG TPA: S-layer protein, partial [Firmicutes bacterium]|nr:S-layer protein [Bacillota bacterium]